MVDVVGGRVFTSHQDRMILNSYEKSSARKVLFFLFALQKDENIV